MPSVMQTTRGISALIASSIPAAASGGLEGVSPTTTGHQTKGRAEEETNGTNIAVAVAPVSFTASDTLAKTGRPGGVLPAFFGFVPPTTFVPAQGELKLDPFLQWLGIARDPWGL